MKRRALITGGAGFIGCNAAHRLIRSGWDVVIWDNLCRRGGDKNLAWLRTLGSFSFDRVDLREEQQVSSQYRGNHFDLVLHCAGQVAVSTSVADPRGDLECNVMGTFNLLEAIRAHDRDAFMIFASTNKVYGGMDGLGVVERNGRYEYANLVSGVAEDYPLDFHSPYGCSKGAADQYVRDYSRIYGLTTVSFRQSCIYGCRQFGIEDQGWVAWFVIAHALRRPVTIYGDGKQTRDVLFIDDLIDAYLLAYDRRDRVAGKIYNIGGGPQNQLSLIELIDILKQIRGREIQHSFADWRPGDQRVFVADIRKAKADLGWEPSQTSRQGIETLIAWVDSNLELFR